MPSNRPPICWLRGWQAVLVTTFAALTFGLLFASFIGPQLVQRQLDQGIRDAIVWTPTSAEDVDLRYRGLCDPQDPRALFWNSTIYLYNITNLDAIRLGAKPRLELVGPYRYLKLQCKLDVWWDGTGVVAAKDYTRYLPVEGPGQADLDANITTINLALASVIESVHGSVGPSTARLLDLLVSVLAGWKDQRISGMFVHRTARELLWGYEDTLLERLQMLLPPGSVPRTRVNLIGNHSSVDQALSARHSVYDTGLKNIKKTWTVLDDQGVKAVTAWPGGVNCSEKVRGTDGLQFRPGLHSNNNLTLWVPQLYRAVKLVCNGTRKFYQVKVQRYFPESSWNQPNGCKCQTIPGLLNISAPSAVGPGGNGSAALGAPIFVSAPHFCGADASLRQGVTGLPDCANIRPESSLFLDVEPISGITMKSKVSIMMSSQVSPAARLHLEPKINNSAIIPVFWNTETIQGGQAQAEQFASRVYGAQALKAHVRVWPLIASLFTGAACACVLLFACANSILSSGPVAAALRRQEDERQARQAIIDRALRAGSGNIDQRALSQPLIDDASQTDPEATPAVVSGNANV